MAHKRKHRADDTESPRKSPRTGKADQFRSLCWDCAAMVLEYLEPRDLAQCERVDKGWRDFIQVWISVVGLRRQCSRAERTDDVAKAVMVYKDHSAIEVNLPACRPVGVYKITASLAFFTVAGDFAAWEE
ncbi:F-box protein [Aspergillus lucknowensis]|uniref:F-box domain-containing protein n=1 Tax=Aspergillus lucknowensis TaxID=176173 RepID=A0ABR4LKB7_9EURO